MIKTIIVAAALSFAATAASAVSSGSFTPEASDDMESYAGGRTNVMTLFSGSVTIGGPLQFWSVDQGDWIDFRSSADVVPTSGTKFGAIAGFGSISFDFSGIGGVTGFSGYATGAGIGADVIEFFDLFGASLGSVTDADGFGPGNGTMEFFSFVSSTPIGSIRWVGQETAFDDFGYTTAAISPVPLPAPAFLLLAGFGGLGVLKLRRKSAAA